MTSSPNLTSFPNPVSPSNTIALPYQTSDRYDVGGSLDIRVKVIHDEIKAAYPHICRVAVALYDSQTDVLKTFVNSTDDGSPLEHYEAVLANVPSLQELALGLIPRTIDDLRVLAKSRTPHTRKILEKGYRSSYTKPIVHNEEFYGFVFFDSTKTGYFTETVVHNIDVYAQLVGLLCITEFNAIHTLQAAVKTAREISLYRDEETGSHLIRMANYSRLIALEMAITCDLSDEFIEFLFHFAPLHDIGKIAIPDVILLKEGPLTSDERSIMQTHVFKGAEIVDKLINGFKMEKMPKIDMLKNIVLCHHEALDGSGYPQGLHGDAIPLEARIVSVADVFDALTSARPYKQAWSVDDALAHLQNKSTSVFDARCVKALISQRDKVEDIQKRFHEDIFG